MNGEHNKKGSPEVNGVRSSTLSIIRSRDITGVTGGTGVDLVLQS